MPCGDFLLVFGWSMASYGRGAMAVTLGTDASRQLPPTEVAQAHR